ncbi:PQQ-binding-like beta-propeller repeat protein [Actinomadura scrupuli]|uniref:outer membrane protein assembly factor BamB family protein n=1 Tax=Actinomadura scrupuli TaxID=559629 RepID=UPI003D95FA40
MAGSRQRAVVGLVAAMLAVATLGVVVDKFVLQAEWWQEDHRTTTEPAPPLLDVGPPPGPVALGWQLDTVVRRSGLSPYDQVAHALVDGQLLVATTRGLDVRDARTGERRWHYHREDWVLLGWAATRHHLIAYVERAGHRDNRMILGFDAAGGRLLWRQQDEVPAATERSTLRWPAGSDVVLTAAAGDRSVLRGRSVATGEQVWTHALPRGCTLPEAGTYASDADDALAAISLDCEDRSRVLAIDPQSGRTRWVREFDAQDPPEIAVRGEVVLVSDGTALRAYDQAGREFLTRPGDDVCGATMCPAVVSGGHLIVVYRSGPGDDGRRLESIQISSHRSAWRRTAPAYPALVAKGDRLYALRPNLTPELRPAGIDVIDAGDGRTATVPAPLVVPPGPNRARPWLAAGGGLLYVSVPEALPSPSGAVRLMALRAAAGGPGPAELGGVPAADWPDACGLLNRRDLPGGHRSRPVYVTVGTVRLPRPVSCTYEPDGDRPKPSGREQSAGAPTVTIEWVADSAASASALLAALRASEPQARPVEIGDEAYELNPSSGTIAARVGRYLIGVSAFQTPGLATRLARAVALALHARAS